MQDSCMTQLDFPKFYVWMLPQQGDPLAVSGEQPCVLAAAWVVWRFPWGNLDQQLNRMQLSPTPGILAW